MTGVVAVIDEIDHVVGWTAGWTRNNFGWLAILGATTIVVFLLWIAVSRYGTARLGDLDSRPEHGNVAWFGMLLGAGMGVVLLLWGVAEPLAHYFEPPRGEVDPQSVTAAEDAMAYSAYHFGLHAWAILCLPALATAYVVHRRDLPYRPSSVLHPLLGDRVRGRLGRAVDLFAGTTALLSVASLIGLCALRISPGAAIGIVGLVTAVAAALGTTEIRRGLARLASAALVLALALLAIVLLAGPRLFLAKGVTETAGTYLSRLVPLSFWNDAFASTGWQSNWTVLYWVWLLTLTPYVGLFVARISRGRTIRQFVVGALVLPTVLTIVWSSVFGLSAIDLQHKGKADLTRGLTAEGDVPGALFGLLRAYPMGDLLLVLAIVVLLMLLATMAGSAAFAFGSSRWGRAGFALALGAGAIGAMSLAWKAGLVVLRDLALLLGALLLPFVLVTMYALVRALRADAREREGSRG